MKNLLIVCAIAYATNSFAQKTTEGKILKQLAFEEVYTFNPPRKLMNEEIWTRVSNTRFECNFLRLAIEYQDFEYVLYEMDGLKRELSRARDYNTLGEEIAINTFDISKFKTKRGAVA